MEPLISVCICGHVCVHFCVSFCSYFIKAVHVHYLSISKSKLITQSLLIVSDRNLVQKNFVRTLWGCLTCSSGSMTPLKTPAFKAQVTCPGSITLHYQLYLPHLVGELPFYLLPTASSRQPPKSHSFPCSNSRVKRKNPLRKFTCQVKKMNHRSCLSQMP